MPEPLPDGGWSREVVTVKNATVVPPEKMTWQPVCGVVSEDGDCAHAATWRSGMRMTRDIQSPPPEPARKVSGRHMWGGMYYGHFGHFMVETMSRCWAFDREGIDSVVFVPKHKDLKDFAQYQKEFWDLLGLETDITIAREPTQFEELLVPGQGFGLGKIASGTPEFRAAMRRIRQRIPDDEKRKIYVSRTKFNGRGGVIAEAALERNMAAHGYTIMHPEKMPLLEQFRYYKSATHIIGVDSSAFHIAGMMADPSQRIGFILRRSNGGHDAITAQIRAMIGRDPAVIDVLAAHWMDVLQTESNHLSWGELDHLRLAAALEHNGFIDTAHGWEAPPEDEIAASVARAAEKAKTEVARRPVHRDDVLASANS